MLHLNILCTNWTALNALLDVMEYDHVVTVPLEEDAVKYRGYTCNADVAFPSYWTLQGVEDMFFYIEKEHRDKVYLGDFIFEWDFYMS